MNEDQLRAAAALQRFAIDLPSRLSPATQHLVLSFACQLAAKLAKAQDKYGFNDDWMARNWMDECRQKLVEHVAKGDPLDVAAYCAFLSYHNEPTVDPGCDDCQEVVCVCMLGCADDNEDTQP